MVILTVQPGSDFPLIDYFNGIVSIYPWLILFSPILYFTYAVLEDIFLTGVERKLQKFRTKFFSFIQKSFYLAFIGTLAFFLLTILDLIKIKTDYSKLTEEEQNTIINSLSQTSGIDLISINNAAEQLGINISFSFITWSFYLIVFGMVFIISMLVFGLLRVAEIVLSIKIEYFSIENNVKWKILKMSKDNKLILEREKEVKLIDLEGVAIFHKELSETKFSKWKRDQYKNDALVKTVLFILLVATLIAGSVSMNEYSSNELSPESFLISHIIASLSFFSLIIIYVTKKGLERI